MKKVHTILTICLLAIFSISFSSCDPENPEDPFMSGLIGTTWELSEDQAGYVTEQEVVTFDFFNDNTGIYGFYDLGRWTKMRFTWYSDISGTNRVEIYYANGSNSYFFYRFYGRDLILSTTRDFYLWERYVPTY